MDQGTIVLQARMGSTRLPGKSLAIVGRQSVLAHCIERLRAASGMRVVVATTTHPQDDCVEQEGRRCAVDVFRGAEHDVLARFLMVASALGLGDLVRATADNPAVDIDAPRRVLDLRRRTGADHVVEYGLPYGTAVEAVSVAALTRSADLTQEAHDREHVTTFIRRDARFVAVSAIAPTAVRRPGLRLTIDTPDDLEWVRRVYDLAEGSADAARASGPVGLSALIAAADRLTHAVPSGSGSGARDAR
jgi:spore coat polysaccharide biosynthesis protein SpsF (cytidylyltransferase family)